MMNPLQVTLTHAEQAHPASGGFEAALARVLLSLHLAAQHNGLTPRMRPRVSVIAGDPSLPSCGPILCGTLIAGGPDLPDPASTHAEPGHPVDDELAEPTC